MGRKYQPSTGIIQIWHLGDGVTNSTIDSEMQKPKLDLCLVHDWGVCLDLKWWPIGLYHDPRTNATTSNENGTSDGQLNEELGSIGILGGTFADGSFRLFVVPHPERVREKLKVTSDNEPCFVRIKKVLLDATLPDSTYSKFNFGGLFRIAVGASNGFISIFSLLSASNTSSPKPEIYFPAHDSCVRDIFFGHGGSPSEGNQLISCGLDGKLLFWDLSDLFVPVQLHRTRAFLMSCNWPVSFDVWVLADSENTVRYMRFSGDEMATHVLLGHKGCVWSLATSLYHPFLASASADGSIRVINLNKGRSRFYTPVYNTLYELDYDKERQLLKMTDAVGTEESKANAHKQESQYVQYFPSEAAVQKVVWSTNPQSSCWLTSGGTEGIVRIEMVGRD
ncbi:WD40-repeat-containing domain protein [Paraphysoderma sedebokerense]|nr:WD40-repeat-containing domain protein [Paraphysoderma sedebokerense]